MKKQTRSILEEISGIVPNKDPKLVIESRASNIINSAINLLEQIKQNFTEEEAADLERKLINSIKSKDPNKFYRGIRRHSTGSNNENI